MGMPTPTPTVMLANGFCSVDAWSVHDGAGWTPDNSDDALKTALD